MLLALLAVFVLSYLLYGLSFSSKQKRFYKILSIAFALPIMLLLRLEPLVVENLDLGPCTAKFDGDELGRTKGETQVNYSIETYKIETEEDGTIDEVIIDDALTFTIPLIYTDPGTLSKVIPWAKLVTGTDGKTKLVVGKAIGKRLYQYAKELVIHPNSLPDDDKSKDITIFKAFPKPGPLNFTYSRQGERIANIQFLAVRDNTKPEGEDYFCIGDPSIDSDVVAPTVQSTVPVDDATDVAKGSGLNIDFVMSEDIDPATVIKANTSITNMTSGAPFNSYNVTYDAATKTIRLTTTAALAGGAQYMATIGIGIKDLNGNALAEPKVITFTTAA